jgi:hypothetical protein
MQRVAWRGWTVVVIALLFIVVAGLAAVQRGPEPQTVTAQRIVLVDAAGKELAVLSADATGGMLTFRNRQGEPRLRVGMVGDAAHVDTWDNAAQQWRNRVGFGVVPAR